MRRVVALLIMSLLLQAGSCGRQTVSRLGRLSLVPTDQQDTAVREHVYPANDHFWPCFPVLDTSGTGYEASRLLVGYDNHYDPGTNPMPCATRENWVYRPAMRFEFKQLEALMPEVFIVSARLSFDKRQITPLVPPGECYSRVYTGTGPWPPRGTHALAPAEEAFKLLIPKVGGPGCVGTRCTVEVRGQVDLWLRGVVPNYGFVIVGPNEEMGSNTNDQCLVELLNPRLDIDYRYNLPVITKPIGKVVIPGKMPTTGVISLTVTRLAGTKANATYRLDWAGSSATVDIYRDGTKLGAPVTGSSYVDVAPLGAVTYKVCNDGTAACSNAVTVTG